MRGKVRVGTSGFSYREWLGKFYPTKLPANEMLAYYGRLMPTVEINYTFRALPRPAMLEGWIQKTPDDFRFALKAPERITHLARLRGADENLDRFAAVAALLGPRLGPVLFQLPPDFRRDTALLRDFLAPVGKRLRASFEFRNRSWFDDSTLEILRQAGAALCIAESEKLSTPVEKTADFAYVRLRKSDYDQAALERWAARLAELAGDGSEVYVYLKHELAAPDLARSLGRLLAESR